ncbi:low temperature requirement protein A [Leifsonia shinshuensis]|uniref:Low temperature requirement protein A n=2 Tax=Leifsonia shinshuensis TaxID=150026 RepID=A0A7G6YH16_9MICO|nr:low temperature requirement protein A [Leifsonia shinshuensis]
MTGRDPGEAHRAATPLELLFDLTFVIAFGQAGEELAHLLAAGEVAAGIGAFVFAMFAICWAWINFSWFASAYDTDDWFYRVTTLVQMVGVIVLALGLPTLFASVEHGGSLLIGGVVAGYVVMRIGLVAQWLRAAVQDRARRRVALGYAGFVTAAQVGWVLLALAAPDFLTAFVVAVLLYLVELGGPAFLETRLGGTPWNAGHIAERYGLLTIIALGEVLFGTVTSVAALVAAHGWSVEAALVAVAGVGLTFGLWWTYFIIPSSAILRRHRRRAVVWGYSHVLLFSAIAATGAGLHVVAYFVDGEASIGVTGAIVSVAAPVLLFSVVLFLLYTYLVHEGDPFHVGLFAGTVVVLVAAVWLAAVGGSLGLSLMLVTLSPAVVVVGYETVGYRHQAAALARQIGEAGGGPVRPPREPSG